MTVDWVERAIWAHRKPRASRRLNVCGQAGALPDAREIPNTHISARP